MPLIDQFRKLRLSIASRVLVTGALLLIALTIALLLSAKASVETAMYAQISNRVKIGDNTLWQLVNERGSARIDSAGDLRFGPWKVRGDHSVVDRVKALTGADATIFQVRDGVPIRVTTTVRKLNSDQRNDNTELTGPARAAFEHGSGFTGVSPVAGRAFINNYDLLNDPSGTVVGLIYTGYPLAAMYDAVNDTTLVLLRTSVAGLLILVGLLFAVVRPLRVDARKVAHAARELAGGDVEQIIDVRSRDELGDVANAFRDMIAYQQHMTAVADAIAAGDLTKNVAPASDRDRLSYAFLRMCASLRELMHGITQSSAELVDVSVHSTLACSESAIAVDQVATAIRHVAVGAHDQTVGIETAKTSVELLAVTAAQIADGAARQAGAVASAAANVAAADEQISALATLGDTLAKMALRANDETHACAQAVAETSGVMEESQQSAVAAEAAIAALRQRSDAVGAIVSTIGQIAEQTNLLALNAAIESARAGEHGRSFAVVAGEVRKLAERSALATREIGSILTQIADETERVGAAMSSSSARIHAGLELSQSARASLASVDEVVAQTRSMADDVAARANAMRAVSAQLAQDMTSVTAIVEANVATSHDMERATEAISASIAPVAIAADQQSREADSVLAATEQLSAQVHLMGQTSHQVRGNAEAMSQLASRFRVGAQDGATASTPDGFAAGAEPYAFAAPPA